MKISFSTLACPDYSWVDIYSMAKDLGFGGIEIRGLGQDIFAVNARPFTDERLPKTLEKLRSLNLEIPCLASGCGLKYKEDFDKFMDGMNDVISYIKQCRAGERPAETASEEDRQEDDSDEIKLNIEF